jgi:hypothetical protein
VLGIKTTQALEVGGAERLPELEASDLGGKAAREYVYVHCHERFLRVCCPTFRQLGALVDLLYNEFNTYKYSCYE